MPKSKREKLVSLTKTKKRSTVERKGELMNDIRNCLEKYKYVYVFDLANCRSQHVKEVRSSLTDSRIFMTKNKVMQKALGTSPEDEAEENLHHLSKYLTGLCGLMFTNKSEKEIVDFFNKFEVKDYARSGYVPNETIKIPAGPIQSMPHSMEEILVTLGLPVDLKNGVLTMRYEHTVCKVGEPLTPEQAKILKHFQIQLSSFKMILKSVWNKETQKVQKLD